MRFQFTDPVKDFSDGIDVLRCYHDDFFRRGKDILNLTGKISEEGVNQALAYQCIEHHNYYTRANKLHHQDEEHALFPVIVGDSPLIDGMIERLVLDHEEIEAAWTPLAKLLASPELIKDFSALMEFAEDFEKLQREHLTRENEDFLPHITSLLNELQLKEMGHKMASFRHV
jgi:hemerythrin-like domain-containing protein